MENAEDFNEFLEARALVKAFRTMLGFEQELRQEVEELRHGGPIAD